MTVLTEAQARLAILREKQTRMPELAEKWAQRIFEDIFQGDEMIDDIEALAVDIEPPEDFDDPEDWVVVLDHYVEGIWHQILQKIHARINALPRTP